ncbi:MAG TPA: GNAT family N-acetyltransferase [Gemmataceae bacterium]|nr:GNAT family N-acetyltransferase [Gemmataceae bacterium]
MADWTIERLNSHHEREAFCCGNASLDVFLKTLAGQYEKRRLGQTFVAVRAGENAVCGYYTSAAGSLDLNALPEKQKKRLPKHPLPAVHLGRLAVNQCHQGRRLGETLLFHFLHTALDAAKSMGVYAVDVLATDDKARGFYLQYGFLPLQDIPLHLYLPMRTIEQMFDATG